MSAQLLSERLPSQSKNPRAAAEHKEACARVAARFREPWLRSYVRHKLRGDPIFAAAFELLRKSDEPLLDVGCGVGLLAFYLRERNFLRPITGLDCDGRKIARARAVAGDGYDGLEFFQRDVRRPITQRGNAVLFDVLHYLPPNDQLDLLARLAGELAPGGVLMIRDCPRDGSGRFWLTLLAERFAQITNWNLAVPLHFPTREKIEAVFPRDEFSRRVEPLWGRTLFNNHLFVFRRRVPGAL